MNSDVRFWQGRLMNDLVNDGLDSGYSGNFLDEYVYDHAVNSHRIPVSLVESFIAKRIGKAEEQLFDD